MSEDIYGNEIPYGPGHPSYIAPLPDDLVDALRGREFDANEERERLRSALKPFADLAKTWCCNDRPNDEVVTGAVIHAGDLEAARRALEETALNHEQR